MAKRMTRRHSFDAAGLDIARRRVRILGALAIGGALFAILLGIANLFIDLIDGTIWSIVVITLGIVGAISMLQLLRIFGVK
jgi:hypothetical protein